MYLSWLPARSVNPTREIPTLNDVVIKTFFYNVFPYIFWYFWTFFTVLTLLVFNVIS